MFECLLKHRPILPCDQALRHQQNAVDVPRLSRPHIECRCTAFQQLSHDILYSVVDRYLLVRLRNALQLLLKVIGYRKAKPIVSLSVNTDRADPTHQPVKPRPRCARFRAHPGCRICIEIVDQGSLEVTDVNAADFLRDTPAHPVIHLRIRAEIDTVCLSAGPGKLLKIQSIQASSDASIKIRKSIQYISEAGALADKASYIVNVMCPPCAGRSCHLLGYPGINLSLSIYFCPAFPFILYAVSNSLFNFLRYGELWHSSRRPSGISGFLKKFNGDPFHLPLQADPAEIFFSSIIPPVADPPIKILHDPRAIHLHDRLRLIFKCRIHLIHRILQLRGAFVDGPFHRKAFHEIPSMPATNGSDCYLNLIVSHM